MQTVFLSKVIKIGTSLGVIIPVEILRPYDWKRGDYVVFGFADGDAIFMRRLSDLELQSFRPETTIKF